MIGVSAELVDGHINRESSVFSAYMNKRGIDVSISEPLLIDSAGNEVHRTFDEMEVDVNHVSNIGRKALTNEYNSIGNESYAGKLVIDIEGFGEYENVSHVEVMSFIKDNVPVNTLKNNFDNIYAYLLGKKNRIPLGSIITFKDFSNMSFIVKEVKKKRQMTAVSRYKLGRVV